MPGNSKWSTIGMRCLKLERPYFRESLSIRLLAASFASLKRCCTCCTQSRPVTKSRAKIKGSFSSFDASNSCRACFRSRWFQGSPFSSHQWKCFADRKISRYKLKASARWDENLWEACRAFGIQIWGGMLLSDSVVSSRLNQVAGLGRPDSSSPGLNSHVCRATALMFGWWYYNHLL